MYSRMMEGETKTQVSVHEWRDVHVQLIKNIKHKLWFRLLQFNLNLHDFDPYAIFKSNDLIKRRTSFEDFCFNKIRQISIGHKRQQQQQQQQQHPNITGRQHDASLYRTKELQLRHTRRDDFRQRSTRLLKMFTLYFLIKSFVISFAHYTLMRYEYLVPKNMARPMVSLESVQVIARLMGIPFYPLKDISLTLFFTATCFANICIVVLPLIQRRYPVNIASLRFVLDPKFELLRVDASVRRKLAAIKCSLEVYERQQAYQYYNAAYFHTSNRLHVMPRNLNIINCWTNGLAGCHRRRAQTLYSRDNCGELAGDNQIWLNNLKQREQHYCRKLSACLDGLSGNRAELESLRPSTFEVNHFVSTTKLLEQIVLNSHSNYLCIWLVITTSLIYSTYSFRCPQLNCDPRRVFSGPEMLVALEAQTILAITCFSCSLNFSLLAILTASQLKIIKSIQLELITCQQAIANFIYMKRASWPGGQAKQKLSCVLIDLINDKNFIHIDMQRDKLEARLLKSITRLAVCDSELKDNARCISQQTVHPACYLASALFLAALNLQFKLPESNFLRSFVLGVIWLSVNMVAISCANIHARVLGLQRNLWSILALSSQLLENNNYYMQVDMPWPTQSTRTYHDMSGSPLSFMDDFSQDSRQVVARDGARRRLRGKCCTFVADLWLKFVYSTSANIEQHCSRLLNIELSYRNIIEANFFSIFIYSLTLAYDR